MMRRTVTFSIIGIICMVFVAYADLFDDYDFENVDVAMETEWSDPETSVGVDVLLVEVENEVVQIVLFQKKQKISEITLMDGVTVKIFDHETGKLLRKYGPEKGLVSS